MVEVEKTSAKMKISAERSGDLAENKIEKNIGENQEQHHEDRPADGKTPPRASRE